MNVIEIFAKFLVDTKDLDKGLDEAEKKASSAGNVLSGIGNGLLGLGKLGAEAIGAAATATGALAKQATDAYTEFEQLEGGVKTLFGDSTAIANYRQELEAMGLAEAEINERMAEYTDPVSATVMENAAKAYQTAGMSANDYMNTVIGMAGALNKATGDVELSSRLADLAIIDMSDNVNKMGTSMESVQNAYRGFSRGNFTMLDNLSLGFAGTKEGMQELLDSAKAISGVEYDIESYADIVNAIHVVQENMGIAGTTATEAADTISGSAGAMKAAWDNLVLGIADPDADLGKLITAVVGSAEVALQNVLPIFSQALTGIGNLVQAVVPIISQELPGIIESVLPQILNAAMSLLEGVTAALPELIKIITDQTPLLIDSIKMILDAIIATLPDLLSAFTDAIPPLIQAIVDILSNNMPMLVQAVIDMITQLASSMSDMLPDLIVQATNLITQIILVLTDPNNITAVLQAGVDIILALVQGLSDALPILLDALPLVIDNIVDALVNGLPILIEGTITLVTGIVNQLPSIIRRLSERIPQIIRSIVSAITQTLPILIQGVVTLVEALVKVLPDVITALIDALPQIVSAIVDALVVSLPLLINGAIDLVIALVDALPEVMQVMIDAMPVVLEMIINTLMDNIPILLDGIIALQTAIWEHLPEIMKVLFDLIPPMFTSLVTQLTQNLPILIAGVVNILGVIATSLLNGVSGIFNKVTGTISEWWNGLKADVSGAFDLFIADFVVWLEELPYNLGVFLAEMINKFVEWKDNVLDWIKTDLPLIINGIINWFVDLPANIGQFFTDIYDNLMQWVADMIVMVEEEVPKIIDEIARFFEELPGKAIEWGADMISSFVEGVNSMWDQGIESVKNFAQGIADNIAFSEPKDGPLANFHTYAPDMMDLFAEGVRENTDVVTNAVQDAFDLEGAIKGNTPSMGGNISRMPGLITPNAGKDVTLIIQLNEEVLGRTTYRLYNDQVQRVGANLEGMVKA